MTFRDKVLQLLYNKRITKSDFADKLGKSRANLSVILKKNNPNQQTIKEFATALEVETEEIISDDYNAVKSWVSKNYTPNDDIKNIRTLALTGIAKRIKRYLDYEGIDVTSFEKEVGFPKGAFASYLEKGKIIGIDKLEMVLMRYPIINSEWLITGEGEMMRGFEAAPKIEVLRRDPNTSIVELGDVIGWQSNIYVVVSPLIEKKNFKKYIQKNQESRFLADLPRHAVSIEIEDVEGSNYGPYRSFEVTDGEITGNVNESISNGSIVTAIKIDNHIMQFNVASLTYKHLVLVMKSGIFINANITASFKECLTLMPPMTNSEFAQHGHLKQYGQFNMGDLIELYAVVAISKAL